MYCQYDLFVFPSLNDGFGLVILEAMAAGIPVAATFRSGAPDVIDDGREGFLFVLGLEDGRHHERPRRPHDPPPEPAALFLQVRLPGAEVGREIPAELAPRQQPRHVHAVPEDPSGVIAIER